jgi:hypothetical protein
MARIIVVFDGKTGEFHGYRDFRQAQDFLGATHAELKNLLDNGGGWLHGYTVGELIMHKSNRGGKRS